MTEPSTTRHGFPCPREAQFCAFSRVYSVPTETGDVGGTLPRVRTVLLRIASPDVGGRAVISAEMLRNYAMTKALLRRRIKVSLANGA